MDINKLTDEQKKKISECKTREDYISVANELGYELSDEQLEQIDGGEFFPEWGGKRRCPRCGSINVTVEYDGPLGHHCLDCGCVW